MHWVHIVSDVRIEGLMVATNTPPNGAFRGFGAPQVMFAAERHMDRIARTLDLDPIAVRRTNLYRDGHITPTGQSLIDVGALEVLDKALACAEENRFHPLWIAPAEVVSTLD